MPNRLFFLPSFPFSRGRRGFKEFLRTLSCFESGQRYDMMREAVRMNTFLFLGISLF